MLREHEVIYVIQPDAAPEREQEIHDRVDTAISEAKGQFLLRDDWGKRKLAYEIEKFQKGHYFQVNFLSDGSCVNEMERGFRLDADLIRFLTVKVSDSVSDIDKRVAEAKVQAAEQAERRAERERLEAEREKERADAAASLAASQESAAEAAAEAAAKSAADASAAATVEASEPETQEPAATTAAAVETADAPAEAAAPKGDE